MRAKIHNRAGEAPDDGWYQIEVTGEHPASGNRVQVIDDAALQSICNRFSEEAADPNFAGMLVDPDHLSHDLDNPTEALAWARELAIRNGELHARLELTDTGAAAVAGKRYKFFSTEYDASRLEDLGGGRVRPLRLSGLAFTNRPNNRGAKPISNRDAATPPPTNENETIDMQSIAEKLGLDPAASEADILQAIAALQTQCADMQNRCAAEAADKVMNRLGERVPEAARPQWREQLIANREQTEAFMEASFPAVAAAVAPERIHNRAAANAPDPVADAANPERAKEIARMNHVNTIRNRDHTTFERSWETARAEKPELF